MISRTILSTGILLAPADANTTVTSDASSAPPSAAPAAGAAAATATGAAADTPNFSSIAFTSSAASIRVNFSIDSKIVSTLLILLSFQYYLSFKHSALCFLFSNGVNCSD